MSDLIKGNVGGVSDLRYAIVKSKDKHTAVAVFKHRGDAESLCDSLDDPNFIVVELLDQLGYVRK